jgi:L-threonylcarbamoyladenylate synthase
MSVQPLSGEQKKILKGGGVVLHATETCYGLAADIFNKKAVEKIYVLKKMDGNKPVSIMVRGLAEAKKYAIFNQQALGLAKKHWPGPLTLVLPRKKALPVFLNPGHETVGIRCPDHEVARGLIEAADGPLVTTSANVSGKPQAYEVKEFLAQIGGRQACQVPDLIIDSGKIPKRKPSTIVGFGKEGLRIIRKGDLLVD